MAPKIVLHWLENSRAQRILWLLEELELTYEIKEYKRNKKTMLAGPDLRAIHPLGKSPVVTIEEEGKPTITLAESGAITEYIIERFAAEKFGIPTGDAQNRCDYLYWLHWAEGSAMTPLMVTIICAQMPKSAPFGAKSLVAYIASQIMKDFATPRNKENFDFVESTLQGKDFFAGGKLTGADFMMTFPIESLQANPEQYSTYPNIQRWYNQISARPAFKKALQAGAANDLAAFTR